MKLSSFLKRIFHNWPIKILAVAASIMLFFFHNISAMEERFFTVPLEVKLPENYVPAEPYHDEVRVKVRGMQKGIEKILAEDILAYIDLTDFQQEGIIKKPVQIQRQGNADDIEHLEITVDPLQVIIRLEREIKRSVEVVPSLKGFPAPGYEMTQYFVSPSSVDITGPRSHVQGISSVTTEDINLSGKQSDISVRVRLVKPNPFVVFPGGAVVEFRGTIEEAVVLKSFSSVDIVAVDLQPGLKITSRFPQGSISVQGPQLVIEQVKPEKFQLIIRCTDIQRPGIYQRKVTPKIPEGLLVLKYEPTTMEIRVERAD